MKTTYCRRIVLTAAASLLTGAADRPDPNPDARIEIEEVRFGLFAIGGSFGGGRLRYRGQEHPFSISGLGSGSVGISSVRASGEVFGLRRLEDFPDTYTETQVAAVAGQSSRLQVRWLRSPRGVELRLRSTRQGVMLDISASGLMIKWN